MKPSDVFVFQKTQTKVLPDFNSELSIRRRACRSRGQADDRRGSSGRSQTRDFHFQPHQPTAGLSSGEAARLPDGSDSLSEYFSLVGTQDVTWFYG